jgi:rhomboid protease GluP
LAAEKLVAILPKRRTTDFRPQVKADAEFGAKLIAQSPRIPITIALVAINTFVFVATLIAGAEWLIPVGRMQIAWGSNFGPYTTDGEWWRLFTSVFIHFGIPHLVLNMTALVIDDGLRKNDPKVIATAGQDLRQLEQSAKERQDARQ